MYTLDIYVDYELEVWLSPRPSFYLFINIPKCKNQADVLYFKKSFSDKTQTVNIRMADINNHV